jgi:hypothetical protein
MQTTPLRQQRGATIFEILVSVLILSFGILALVGLQARSLSAAGDAKYRIEATNYADQIVGQMWADRLNIANYPTFVAPEGGLAGAGPGGPARRDGAGDHGDRNDRHRNAGERAGELGPAGAPGGRARQQLGSFDGERNLDRAGTDRPRGSHTEGEVPRHPECRRRGLRRG